MEIPFPAIHLYAALALAATLASLVASDLRSSEMWGPRMRQLMAFGTCALLLFAWGHLLSRVLAAAREVWVDNHVVARHLATHLLILAAMLPIVCATILGSWKSGAKKSVQLDEAP